MQDLIMIFWLRSNLLKFCCNFMNVALFNISCVWRKLFVSGIWWSSPSRFKTWAAKASAAQVLNYVNWCVWDALLVFDIIHLGSYMQFLHYWHLQLVVTSGEWRNCSSDWHVADYAFWGRDLTGYTIIIERSLTQL